MVFERKKSYCSQNSLAIVWCLGANCNERRYSAAVGLAIQRRPNKRAQRGSQWLTIRHGRRPCHKSQQQNSWKSVVHNFWVIDMFSTNFTYISLWNVVERLQCLLSLCKMGAQNANRWTKKKQHIRLNIPSAIQQPGGEIPRSYCDWWQDWEFLQPLCNKKQSMACKHTGSPKPKKFIQTFHGRKLMATVFWDRKGVLLVAFMNPGTTIISKVYCEILKQLRRGIQDRWRGLLTFGVMLLYANTRPLTAVLSCSGNSKWESFYHPPFSPDMTPNDFHLLLHLKTFLDGEVLKSTVENWLDI